ncbi:putative lipase [Aspergillus candidus]|uniref:Putative lipase n=1 Tax=Aspergillus candidus TaxID=41067 RepID=A0A2I2F7S1_ASPCN|nr:putative lipase [Aspergillus candidus]PLB36676.1 putative lipase [Aspergillus candidus]
MRFGHPVSTALLSWLVTCPAVLGAALPRADSSSHNDLESILAGHANGSDDRTSRTAAALASRIADANNQPDPGDRSMHQAWGKIESIFNHTDRADQPDLFDYADGLVSLDLIPSDILSFLNGYLDWSINSIHNRNPAVPDAGIYPSKDPADAPYSVAEADLRAAIHIPEDFSYGRQGKKPVILVPGTAIPAGTTYHFNLGQLGHAAPEADVVWVNIPQASLRDAQENAEYVAYAIHYIAALSHTSVSVISWSQGGLDTQWALKYWPSTRAQVEDFIAVSPDFRGTAVRSIVCPALDLLVCTPSLWQQGWETEFIQTARADGGDSAYVPTTTIYSTFDEIVQPQSGDDASALLKDARSMGVSNNHLQTVCANRPAGGIYTHEGTLYNPLTWALIIDALTHDGPGDVSRLDLDAICQQVLPKTLGLDDILGTEGILLVAVAELLLYVPKAFKEPRIADYAA